MKNHIGNYEQYKLVMDAVPGPFTILDSELNYFLINKFVQKLIGLPEREILGKPLGFSGPSDFQEIIQDFANSSDVQVLKKIQIKGTVGLRWFVVCMTKFPTGEIAISSVDVDDLVKAEETIAAQRQVAEQSARLVTIGELAAGIAHEVNNPLSFMTGKLDILIRKMRGTDQEQHIPDLEKIKETGFRIGKIVRGVKSLSRDSATDPLVETKVLDIIDDVITIYEVKFKHSKVELKKEVDPNIKVQCRPAQIGQVILNLISNAVDELKDKPGSWIKVDAKILAEFTDISVTDSGPGIPEHVRKKIMTPFFTTKPVGIGTGLGLSISRRIAAEHNGQLFLDDKSPNTRFVLRLPNQK